MNSEGILIQASERTRSWILELRDSYPSLGYRESKYWAALQFGSKRRALVYFNPAKDHIRLFLPLNPDLDPDELQSTPSSGRWAERFPAIFNIKNQEDLLLARRWIDESRREVEGNSREDVVNVEEIDISDTAIDLVIRASLLRIGIVPTDDALAVSRRRRGQDRVRHLTLQNYGSKCALCDIDEPGLLIASHIVGWSENPEARGLLSNVICLCRFHDVLFENGYWSLEDDMRLLKRSPAPVGTLSRILDLAVAFRQPIDHPPAACFLRQHRLRWGFHKP